MESPPSITSSIKKVAFTGAECSGKTTLITDLAAEYSCTVVPEYFRYYWEGKKHTKKAANWTSQEFLYMAKMQASLEGQLSTFADDLVLSDTCGISYHVWHYRYLGRYSPELTSLFRRQSYDLLFLCDTDIPFYQDGVRDGEKIRVEMTGWIEEQLNYYGISFVKLSGGIESRLLEIKKHLNSFIDKANP